jgi:hypothetical protein
MPEVAQEAPSMYQYVHPWYVGLRGFWTFVMAELDNRLDDSYGGALVLGYTLPLRSLERRAEALSIELSGGVGLHECQMPFGGDAWHYRVMGGLKYSFRTRRALQPYVAAGAAWHLLDYENYPDQDGFGGYLAAGVDYYLPFAGNRLSVGVDVRAHIGKVVGAFPMTHDNMALVVVGGTILFHF